MGQKKTAYNSQDGNAQLLTGVPGATEDATLDMSRATVFTEGTSGNVNFVNAAAERAGDANDTTNAVCANKVEDPANTEEQSKLIQLPDLYWPELKPLGAIL